jgi:hypothetical protein
MQRLKEQLQTLETLLTELNAPRSIIFNVTDIKKTINWLENYVQRF